LVGWGGPNSFSRHSFLIYYISMRRPSVLQQSSCALRVLVGRTEALVSYWSTFSFLFLDIHDSQQETAQESSNPPRLFLFFSVLSYVRFGISNLFIIIGGPLKKEEKCVCTNRRTTIHQTCTIVYGMYAVVYIWKGNMKKSLTIKYVPWMKRAFFTFARKISRNIF
jgi:hypothetical protein